MRKQLVFTLLLSFSCHMFMCDASKRGASSRNEHASTWASVKRMCANKWNWAPLAASLAAIGWDASRIIGGKKPSYAGLAGLAALPALFGINYYFSQKNAPLKVPLDEPKPEVTITRNISNHACDAIIQQYNGIPQGYGADCGYHAIYNAICLATNNIGALNDVEAFEERCSKWKRAVEWDRSNKITSGTSNIDSREIEEIIIKRYVPELCSYHNISIISYLDGMNPMIEQGAVAGIDQHTVRNIQRFQEQKKAQVIILNSAKGDVYKHHNKSWHWFVVKLEYNDDDTVQMTVVDSLMGDSTNNPALDKLYHLFAHTNITNMRAFAG